LFFDYGPQEYNGHLYATWGTAGDHIYVVVTITITPAMVGVPYTLTIPPQGMPSGWENPSGPFPPGLSFNTDTGVISGTPTRAGTYTFTLTEDDVNTWLVYKGTSPTGPSFWTKVADIAKGGDVFGCGIWDSANHLLWIFTTNAANTGAVLYRFDLSTDSVTGTFTCPVALASLENDLPIGCVTSDGSVVIGYRDGTGAQALRFKPGSSTWTGPTTIHAGYRCAAILANGTDVLYVAVNTFFAGPAVINTLHADDSLGTEQTVENTTNVIGGSPGGGIGPYAIVFGGEIFISFNESSSTNQGIIQARLSDLSTWTINTFPGDPWSTGPNHSIYPQIGISQTNFIVVAGNLYATWNAQTFDGGGNLLSDQMYVRKYLGGGSWDVAVADGLDFVAHPAAAPAHPPSLEHSSRGLSDNSVGALFDFNITAP
jgi:hypothetical protein